MSPADPELPPDPAALAAGAALLGHDAVDLVETLGGGHRSAVHRVRVPDGGTAILKHYLQPEATTWLRESSGLAVADGAATPRLLGVASPDDGPAVVAMSDLGAGSSLADLLLGRDPALAAGGIARWAAAVGHFQRATRHRIEEFVSRLGDVEPRSTLVEVDGLADTFRRAAEVHDLPWRDDLSAAVAEAVEPLRRGEVLSPGDTCPDNNLLTEDTFHLLDLEFAEVRHPAWEAAYLSVPWPTCWCAWQIPAAETARGLAAYLRAADVADVLDFAELVDRATWLWCLTSVAWFVDDLDADNGETDRRPGRRTLVLARLEIAGRAPGSMGAFARDLRADLLARWGEHPLALAPAFA